MKAGSLADSAFYPDAATVGVHNMSRDRKSQARAACFARSRGIHAVKSFEDAFQIRFRNADARVGNRENDVMAIGTCLQLNLSACGCVLQRVIEQILQNFAELH